MYNPDIIKFLSQYDKSEWDVIIEDLIMFSINKIKEIEKEKEKEEPLQKQIENPRKINMGEGIISFNSTNCTPYEYAKNALKNNQVLKSNSGPKNNTLKKLDELNNKLNVIQSGNKSKKIKKNK